MRCSDGDPRGTVRVPDDGLFGKTIRPAPSHIEYVPLAHSCVTETSQLCRGRSWWSDALRTWVSACANPVLRPPAIAVCLAVTRNSCLTSSTLTEQPCLPLPAMGECKGKGKGAFPWRDHKSLELVRISTDVRRTVLQQPQGHVA